ARRGGRYAPPRRTARSPPAPGWTTPARGPRPPAGNGGPAACRRLSSSTEIASTSSPFVFQACHDGPARAVVAASAHVVGALDDIDLVEQVGDVEAQRR